MNSDLDLSIIVPVYNLEELLPRCLDSILNQPAPLNFECLVVDDGSTDGSLDVARTYEKKYPVVKVVTQPNGGVGVARNTGMDIAQGRYIWFVDSDDCITGDALRHISQLFKQTDDEPDIFVFHYMRQSLGTTKRSGPAIDDSRVFDKIPKLKSFSLKEYPDFIGTIYYCWNKIFRRRFLVEKKIIFFTSRVIEDNFFIVTALMSAKKIQLSLETIYIYTVMREESQNTVYDERRLEALSVIEASYRAAMDLHLSQEIYKFFYLRQTNSLLITWQRTTRPGLRQQVEDYFNLFMSRIPKGLLADGWRDGLIHKQFVPLDSPFNEFALQEKYQDKPFLSVLVPVASAADCAALDQCLGWLVRQTISPRYVEVIVAYRHSNELNAVCQKYVDRYPHIKGLAIDVGGAGTPNEAQLHQAAYQEAIGEYICFLNTRVCLTHTALQSMVREAVLSEADLLMNDFCSQSSADWLTIRTENPSLARIRRDTSSLLPEKKRKMLISSLAPVIWRNVYRRTLLEKIGLAHRAEKLLASPSLMHFESVAAAESIHINSGIDVFQFLEWEDAVREISEALEDLAAHLAPKSIPESRVVTTYQLMCLLPLMDFLPSQDRAIFKARLGRACPSLKLGAWKNYRLLFFGPEGFANVLHDFFASRRLYATAVKLRKLAIKVTAFMKKKKSK